MATLTYDGVIVTFQLMTGAIDAIGNAGYTYQIPGLGDGTESNTQVTSTHTAAAQSEVMAFAYVQDHAEAATLRDQVKVMQYHEIVIVDQHGERWDAILTDARPKIIAGGAAFGGVSYPYRVECRMLVEAIT